MAENVEKKLLLNVEIKAKEALENLAKLRIESDNLRQEQAKRKKSMQEIDTTTDEGNKKMQQARIEYETLGQQIKAYNAEANKQQKEIQSNISYQNELEGSLQQLKSELSLNTTAYNKLSEAERNTVGDF